MARCCILFCLIVGGFAAALGQDLFPDSLFAESGFFETTYRQGLREITFAEFQGLLRGAPDSTIHGGYDSGRNFATLGDVLVVAGGFGLGYGLSSKPTNNFALIGGGVFVVTSVVFAITGNGRMREAVARYNQFVLRSRVSSPPSPVPP